MIDKEQEPMWRINGFTNTVDGDRRTIENISPIELVLIETIRSGGTCAEKIIDLLR